MSGAAAARVARVRATVAVVIAVAGLPTSAARAQDAVRLAALVTARVEPETVTVGEPFTVRIRVRAPKSATIHFPAVPDTADAIEAVDPRAMEDAGDAELVDRTAVYRLVAWDVGRRTPRFADVTVGTGGTPQRYAVALPPVTVLSLLPADSAQRMPKDARDPVAPPGALWKFLLLGALLLAGLASYWWWRRVHRARRSDEAPRDTEPFAAALASFGALDALALPPAGEPGAHVIASVDVLRAYLARRFPGMRESLTALEIERALPGSDLPVMPQRLAALLDRESAIRFARAAVTEAEALALGNESRAIARDVQAAYDARLRAMERRPQRGRRR